MKIKYFRMGKLQINKLKCVFGYHTDESKMCRLFVMEVKLWDTPRIRWFRLKLYYITLTLSYKIQEHNRRLPYASLEPPKP